MSAAGHLRAATSKYGITGRISILCMSRSSGDWRSGELSAERNKAALPRAARALNANPGPPLSVEHAPGERRRGRSPRGAPLWLCAAPSGSTSSSAACCAPTQTSSSWLANYKWESLAACRGKVCTLHIGREGPRAPAGLRQHRHAACTETPTGPHLPGTGGMAICLFICPYYKKNTQNTCRRLCCTAAAPAAAQRRRCRRRA